MREELPANRRRKVAVDRKIVPLEHVTDHARGDHSTCLRGIHLGPQPVGILQAQIYLSRIYEKKPRPVQFLMPRDREIQSSAVSPAARALPSAMQQPHRRAA